MATDVSTIGLQRLYHQRITHPTFVHAGEVAAWLGAMQGQDYAGAKWSFGLRLPGSTDAGIEQAIAEKRIVRTWVVRGTLHYVAAEDVHWMVGLIAPRQIAGNARRYRELELDEATLVRSTDLLANELQDGMARTRPELLAVLEAHGISTAGQRGVYMLQRAALELLIVQGAMQRNVTTFMALEARTTLLRDVALAELARRYFTSRGPATLADFTQWSGLPAAEARTGLGEARPALSEERFGDRSYVLGPNPPRPPEHPLYLLPGFDEYVLGYQDRSAVLDAAHADAICPGGNGIFMPTIVSGGRIIGTWKRTLKKKAVEIAVEPFRPLDADELDALAAAAARYGAYLGLPAKLVS